MSPGLEHILLLGFELRQHFQRNIVPQAQVFLATNPPAAATMGLQQKYIVAIKMRADASAITGIADHEVIKARIRNKTELLHEGVHLVVVQIHTLHQQRPVGLLEGRQ